MGNTPRGVSKADLELIGWRPMYLHICNMSLSPYEPVFQYMVDDLSEDEIIAANARDGEPPLKAARGESSLSEVFCVRLQLLLTALKA